MLLFIAGAVFNITVVGLPEGIGLDLLGIILMVLGAGYSL